jgi:sugar phosphate isomerase/epimerase
MELGCAVGCFTYPQYSAPYEDAVHTIGELGFKKLEMIIAESSDIETYYTPQRIKSLKQIIDEYGMEVSELILYAHLVTGLVERDETKRQMAIDTFSRGMEIAAKFGTDTVNIVSNWPNELKTPISYPPAYFHPNVNGVERFETKLTIDLPSNFDASGLWELYIHSLEELTVLCEKANMYLALEGHANVIVGTTDAFLRAVDRIKSDHFTTNFDTAWQMVQREYLPWSVYKLQNRIRHVHLRDCDGMSCYQIPPGMGIIDWNSFVRALKEVGFDGTLSFELGGLKYARRDILFAKEYMTRILQEENALTVK